MSAFLHLVVLVVASIGVPLAAAHAATTFAINRTGDAGDRRLADAACASSRERGKQCTLRAAMEEANDTPGADGIRFNIASRASVKTISLARPLPSITEALTIDGYTQRGARANTLATGSDAVLKIQLNGTNADTAAVPEANGLTILAAGSTVEGLAINRFSGDGIQLSASDGTVQGNYLGTNASGTQKLGNNNVVFVNGTNNTIGGTAAGARNLLSGNDRAGVFIFGSSSANNDVQGNRIGTGADGTGDVANADGVFIMGSNDNTVGGRGAAGNLISNNDRHGLFLFGGIGSGNEVVGNAIASNGVDSVSVSNGGAGARVDSFAQGSSIPSNQIFASSGLGIDLEGGSSLGSDVTNNDPDDPDTGANNLQKIPVIASATRDRLRHAGQQPRPVLHRPVFPGPRRRHVRPRRGTDLDRTGHDRAGRYRRGRDLLLRHDGRGGRTGGERDGDQHAERRHLGALPQPVHRAWPMRNGPSVFAAE